MHYKNIISVLALQEWQDKCFGVAGMARKVFWCIKSGKKIVLGTPSQDQRAEQNMVVTYDDSAPFSSNKICKDFISGNHN